MELGACTERDTMTDSVSPAGPEGALAESEDILADVERLLGMLSAHPDPVVGETVTALLANIDVVHRTALTRLMGGIRSMAGDAFVNRLTGDPAIRLLLMSYDLLAVDRRTLAEEALDVVRGHLHSHDVDVELVEVLGGVVAVRVHGVRPDDPAYAAALRDVSEALSVGLLGFQELEVRQGAGARPASEDSIFLPAAALQRAKRPLYRAACSLEDIASGTTRAVIVDGVSVLVANVDGELFAVSNHCGDGPLPLDYSVLSGAELVCSWHGCRYDIRTGRRLDYANAAADEQLTVLPVRAHEGIVEIVVGTTSVGAAPGASS
jgi:nitrite reductase/ring-hydroxylating ferredoxin subunit